MKKLDSSSSFRKLLLETPNVENDLIPINNVLILGLLYCGGDIWEKSKFFFEFINPSD